MMKVQIHLGGLSLCLAASCFAAGCTSVQPTSAVAAPTLQTSKYVPPPMYWTIKNSGSQIQLDINTNVVESAGVVWQPFSSALKQYPKIRKLKVIWWTVLGGTSRNCVAIYDRGKSTLDSSCSDGYSGGGNIKEHFFYTEVTDPKLHKAAKALAGYLGSNGAGFDSLTYYGCKQIKP